MDPELEAFLRMYLDAGMDPFANTIPAYALGGAQMPLDADGAPDYQKTSDVKNQLAIMSDPAFLATFGDSAGGFRPQDFQGSTTYEAVQAPGYMRMQQYLNSSDPVSRYIAEVIAGDPANGIPPGTANQAETELRQIANTPDHPLYAEITPYIQSYDDMGQPMQDWNRVRDIATSLEKDVLYDPQFNAFDPNTGLPATAKVEETEAMRYFREMGLPMPNERYGMETTNPQNYERMLEARGGIAGAKQAAQTARTDRDTGRAAMMKMMTDRQAQTPDILTSTMNAPKAPAEPGFEGGGNIPGFFENRDQQQAEYLDSTFGNVQRPERDRDNGLFSGISFGMNKTGVDGGGRLPWFQRPAETTGTIGDLTGRPTQPIEDVGPITAPRSVPAPFGANDLSRKMEDEAIKKKKQDIMDASRRMLAAQKDAKERNLGLGKYKGTRDTADWVIARRLAEQGRTPLNDTLQARRQAMARFGLQI